MAQIDHSIYLQQQTPDIFGNVMTGIQNGMKLSDMAKQRSDQAALKSAFQKNVSYGSDGKSSINRGGLLSDLANIDPELSLKYQKNFEESDLNSVKAKKEQQSFDFENAQRQLNVIGPILDKIVDQPSYDQARNFAQQNGIDISKLPTTYNPNDVAFWKAQHSSLQSQFDQNMKNKEFVLKERELDMKKAKNAQDLILEKQKLTQSAVSGEKLPLDSNQMVRGLASKNASKIAIKNQIDSNLKEWPNLSYDQKVAVGRQLLKTLNSTEGADAIGAEEANRLGAKLEFSLGNLSPWNSNPIQFGRDLEGFYEQASNTSKAIGDAVKSNQGTIDQLMGRPLSKPSADKYDSMSDAELKSLYNQKKGIKNANSR